jgi:L-alanine-DL-glutamate epimerase-like enolase superfamily enzyme
MRIASVECIRLTYRYSEAEVWGWPGGTYKGWTAGFVKLALSDGTYGIGEIGDGLSAPDLITPVVDKFTPLLLGEDPRRIRWLKERLYRSAVVWGRRGLAISIISGIECALFDLMGKVLGVPAHVLLGGALQTRLPVYASGGLAVEPDELAREVKAYVDRGFGAVKIRIGFGIEQDVRRVAAARAAIGPNIRLLLDLGGSYLPRSPDVVEVINLIRELEPMNPFWLEEPLHPNDLVGHARLRALNRVPIAAGENTRTIHEVRQFLQAGAVDIIQTDAVYAGGMLEQLEIAALAREYGVSLAPHTWGSAPGLMANFHAYACVNNGLVVEWSQAYNPLREMILAQPLRFEEGELVLPDLPGLGIDISEELQERYPYDPEGAPVLKVQ